MSAAIQVRATSGGGKTTAMRHMLDACKCVAVEHSSNGRKVLAYEGRLEEARVFVLGDYDPARSAGGCDTIPTIDQTIALVDKYGSLPNSLVLFEGLLLAHSWGAMGDFAHEKFGAAYINAFIDTPVNVCISRVVSRRAVRGQATEGDRQAKIVKNVEADHHRVKLCYDRVLNRGGVRVDLRHNHAPKELEALCRKTIILRC